MVILHLIIVNIVLEIYTCWGYQPGELPQIKLSKWMTFAEEDEDEWRTDVDYLNTETLTIHDNVFTVSQHLLAIQVSCEASYPVEWFFHQAKYAEDDLHDIDLRTSRSMTDINKKKTYKYMAHLGISGEFNKATGNYTCRSTKDNRVQSSVFIFWEGSSPPYLILSGRSISVNSFDNQSVILPCYVSQPDVVVLLHKESNGTYQVVPSGDFATFDPKIGFVLQLSLHAEPYGKYKCTTRDNDEDFVLVNVEQGIYKEKTLPNVVSPGASLFYNAKADEMVCCSNSKKAPSLYSVFCSNSPSCEMHKHKLFNVGSNGKKFINGSCIAEKLYSRDSGMTRCRGDGIDISRHFYTDFPKAVNQKLHLYFDWNNIKPENMMYVMAHTDYPVYVNQNVIVTCETLSSYFSEGLLWAILWKNGSRNYIYPKDDDEDALYYKGFRDHEITLHRDMTGIMCLAPVWNSSIWINSTINFDVHWSLRPTIVGDIEEAITFNLNETEKLIECRTTGMPHPNVYWRKNGNNVPENMVIWKENGTSVLIFHRVSHDTQGDYVCTAENYAGSARKLIHVYVIDSGSSWGVFAGIFIPIMVLAFVSVIAFLFWRLQLQKKVMDHLTRVVFRDVDRTDRSQEVTETS